MAEIVKVILDISDEIQELLFVQEVSLPQAIREELPQIELIDMTDPEARSGSKDITTALLAAATLIGALSPVIIRILNQFKPDTTEIRIEEKTVHDADGQPEYTRMSVYTERKYNQRASGNGDKVSEKRDLPRPRNIMEELSGNKTSGSEDEEK